MTKEQREEVKWYIKNYKNKFSKQPSDAVFQNMINKAIEWEKKEEIKEFKLSEEERQKRIEIIKKIKNKYFNK